VRYRGDWDGRSPHGGPLSSVRADPRGGGINNDCWRPPSPPQLPWPAPPFPRRGPPISPNHFGRSARRLPAGGPPGPPRLPQNPPSRDRGYRLCRPPRLPRPLPKVPPPSPQRRPPHFRGDSDNYNPRSPTRQPWGPPPGAPGDDWRSPMGGGWDRPWALPLHPPGPPPGWRWVPSYEAWGEDQPHIWQPSRPVPLWRSPEALLPRLVDQYGGPRGTQDFQWVLTQTLARSPSVLWTWWPAPPQTLRQPKPAEHLSRPVTRCRRLNPLSTRRTSSSLYLGARPSRCLPTHRIPTGCALRPT